MIVNQPFLVDSLILVKAEYRCGNVKLIQFAGLSNSILTEAGYTFDNVVKSTCLLSDMANFGAMNEVYGKRFSENPPARAAFAVRTLPKEVLVEIEMIAAK